MAALAVLVILSSQSALAASLDALRALEHIGGALGVVVPCEDVILGSELGGVIASVDVRVGDRVRRGQTLFRIDDADLRHQVEIAAAAVRSAEAEVERARVAHDVAAKAKFRRQQAADIYAVEEVERAAGAAEIAAAELEAGSARLAEQRAQLARWENDLHRTKVPAPFAGSVATRFVGPGSIVAPTTPIMRIVADRCLIVRFAVPPEQLDAFQPGSPTEVVFADVARPVRATVRSLSPQVDPAIEMVLVEAELTPSGPAASPPRPGSLCRVRRGR